MDAGLNAIKTTSEKVIYKADKFIGNKIADTVTKSNDYNIEKQEPFEEIIIPTEKKDEILNKMRKNIIKMEHCEIYKLLSDPAVSKFVTKKFIKWLIFCKQKYKV